MPEFFVILAGALSLLATAISMIVGYGTIKQRKEAPNEERWKEYDIWRRKVDERLLSVDEKLDNDNRKLKKVDIEQVQNQEFQRLVLKCMKGIIAASPSVTTDEMKRVSSDIDDFLLHR